MSLAELSKQILTLDTTFLCRFSHVCVCLCARTRACFLFILYVYNIIQSFEEKLEKVIVKRNNECWTEMTKNIMNAKTANNKMWMFNIVLCYISSDVENVLHLLQHRWVLMIEQVRGLLCCNVFIFSHMRTQEEDVYAFIMYYTSASVDAFFCPFYAFAKEHHCFHSSTLAEIISAEITSFDNTNSSANRYDENFEVAVQTASDFFQTYLGFRPMISLSRWQEELVRLYFIFLFQNNKSSMMS